MNIQNCLNFMTKEEKIERKKHRIAKRKIKNAEYYSVGKQHDRGISFGRRKLKGRIFTCEMGYVSCELRGWCNGDC
jgi:hypothetical protein